MTTASRALSASASTFTAKTVGRLIFAFGITLYFICQLSVIVIPIKFRETPAGTADAYSYLSKARQMQDCFRQRCPALVDTRAQMQPAADATRQQNDLRLRRFHRFVYIYHPVHSAAVLGLHHAGLSWENALDAISVLGAAMIAAGTAWLLYALFGAGAAGVALFLLAFGVYPGFHGTHWIVPGNLAYGIGLLAWAAIAARVRAMAWLLPIVCLIAVWTHPAGQIHSGIAILLWLAFAEERTRGVWITAFASGIAAASPTFLGLIVTDPVLRFTMFYPPENWTWQKGFVGNLKGAGKVVFGWLKSYGGPGVLILAAAGVFAVPAERRWRVFAFSGLVVLIALGSLVYVLPYYPAELFHRVWIPVCVAVAGLAGAAVWALALRRPPFALDGLRSSLRLLVIGLAAVLAGYTLFAQTITGAAALKEKTGFMTNWGRMDIDPALHTRVIDSLKPGDRLLYRDELALFLYSTYGANKYGAIYYRGMAKTAEEGQWLAKDKNVRYVVFSIPQFFGRVWLHTGSRVRLTPETPVTRDPPETRGLWLRFLNPGKATTMIAKGATAPIQVPAGESRWIKVDAALTDGAYEISRTTPGPVIWLTGVRFASDETTNWPWARGLSLSFHRPPAWEKLVPKKRKGPRVQRFAWSVQIPWPCKITGPAIEGPAVVAVPVSCDSRNAP